MGREISGGVVESGGGWDSIFASQTMALVGEQRRVLGIVCLGCFVLWWQRTVVNFLEGG